MNKKMMTLAVVATAIAGFSVTPVLAQNGGAPRAARAQQPTDKVVQARLAAVTKAAAAKAWKAETVVNASDKEIVEAVRAAVQRAIATELAVLAKEGIVVDDVEIKVEFNGVMAIVGFAGGELTVDVGFAGDNDDQFTDPIDQEIP